MTEHVGWRVFALGDDGRLRPPFLLRYWKQHMHADDDWRTGVNLARCLVSEHEAPDPDCTCGLRAVVGLPEFLDAVGRRLASSPRTLLQECGVFARVRLDGRVLPGIDMPNDDPHSTVRASRARLLDVHLAPHLAEHAAAVQARYYVQTTGHTEASWADLAGAAADLDDHLAARKPPPPPNRQAFLEEVRALDGFGSKSTDDPEAFLPIGQQAADLIRQGVSVEDLGRALFDSDARPTVGQVRALLLAAARHLAPGVTMQGGNLVTEPIRKHEALSRAAASAFGLRQ
jgi:hypothetical protein